jgi:PAS domain S-box-containing protein
MYLFLIFAAQVMLYAVFPFYFAALKHSFRLIFFYVYISIILVVGGFLGAVYSFPLTDTINISGGSLAYGALMMSTVLLVIVERDLNVVRNVIRIVVVVNVFKFFIFSMISWALSSTAILNPFNTSPSVFNVSIGIVILGGALIISELILLVFLFEKIKARSKNVNLLSMYYTIFFICILCLDGILFPLIAFPFDPELVSIVIGGVKGKFVMALTYSVPIIIFLLVFRKNIGQYNTTPIRLRELLFEPKETLIQEIERQHHALEASEENYRHLAESIGDIFFSMDADMRYSYWNRASEEVTGYTREEAIGKTLYDLFPETKGTSLGQFYENVMITQQSARFINQIQMGGQGRYYEISAYPFRGGASVLVRDITERKQAEEELAKRAEQMRALAGYVESVREDERTRIAREIHDEFGQFLTALKMDLVWVSRRLPIEDEKRERLNQASSLVDENVRRVQRIATELRPGLLDDLGLMTALEWQAHEFSKHTGLLCQLNLPEQDLQLNPSLNTTLFRIFQETLTNVARHARASRVDVSLQEDDEALLLSIRDNGRGITETQLTDPHSLGLLGMHERVAHWNGKLSIRGEAGKGTTVTVHIPIPPLENGEIT